MIGWGVAGIACMFIPITWASVGLEKWYRKETIAEEIPRANISSLKTVDAKITFLVSQESGCVTRYTLQAIYAATTIRDHFNLVQQPAEESTFPVRFCSITGWEGNGFFGKGVLSVEGDAVTFEGKRGESGSHPLRFWGYAALCYLALVVLANLLFPVLFDLSIYGEFRWAIVFLVPLLGLVVIGTPIVYMLPLFIQHSHTARACEISDLQRLGCQITLTAPNADNTPARILFHTKTVHDAEVIEALLCGNQ